VSTKSSIPREELTPLIDGDGLIYRLAFAADTQAKERFGTDGYLEEDYVHWAKGNLNTFLNHLLEEFFPRAPRYVLYLGGSKNYRNRLCRTLPVVHEGWKYKGNRDALHKPKYYAESREHLVKEWGAQLSNCRETDDEISVLQFSNPDRSTCIVTQDKDLQLCPGHKFNPIKKEFSYTTLKEADLAFLAQLAQGDTSDNIPGLKGVGPKTAKKLISECEYDKGWIKRELEKLYISQYGPQYGKAVMWENATLLWMQREDWKNHDGSCLKRYREEAVEENVNG
jgi:hypothetical protein